MGERTKHHSTQAEQMTSALRDAERDNDISTDHVGLSSEHVTEVERQRGVPMYCGRKASQGDMRGEAW